jgi:DNA-binding NarL/FixJ family response regulator
MLSTKLNLAITDDHTLFRKVLVDFLQKQPDLNVALQTASYEELLLRLPNVKIDILFMDIITPTINAEEALQLIRHDYPDIKVIILSMSSNPKILNELLELGVHAIISKSDEPSELLNAAFSVATKSIYQNKLFTDILYWNKLQNIEKNKIRKEVSLSEREKTIIRMIWEEKSNKEISEKLFLGVRSIEKIRQDIKEKLDVKSTVAILKYAIREGIINPSSRYSIANEPAYVQLNGQKR